MGPETAEVKRYIESADFLDAEKREIERRLKISRQRRNTKGPG